MPITKTQSFQTEDGQVFETIEKAQERELAGLLSADNAKRFDQREAVIADFIVANRDKVLAILNSTGRKPRRKNAKKAATPKT